MNLKRLLLVALLLLVAVSLLGGNALWHALGWSDQLTVTGRADVVRPVSTEPLDIGIGWGSYGGDAGGNRYSQAAQITPDNVASLVEAWRYRTGTFAGRESAMGRTSFQSTPILVDEQLVFCTPFNEVIALDPATGEERWRFDPEVTLDRRPANEYSCRGVAYWRDPAADDNQVCAARIFTGTVDARMIALDAKNGQRCTGFGDNGEVQLTPSTQLRWPGEFQITSAPVVVADRVVTGTSIGDNLRTAAPRGTVFAFDARSGDLSWVFNPVPQNANDPARETWAGDSADQVGHANVWSSIAVDQQRQWVFLPTSSPSPDYFGGHREGDNRYANSVVALDGASGEIQWHFQAVHHDVWDYDLPAQPGLYEVWRDGRLHDVVAQVTKMGLVFVLDRDTGQPFLPIEERAVPQQGVAEERLSATQPFPLKPEPLVPDRVAPWDAFGITLWDRWACAASIQALRQEGLYTPPTVGGTLAYPFSGGGANWGSAAFEPSRNLLVVNLNNAGQAVHLHPNVSDRQQTQSLSHDAEFAPMEGVPYGMSRELLLSPFGLPCTPPPWGMLAAVDLANGELVWRRPLGTTEDLAGGLALPLGTPNFGGPITTAGGLIFIGAAMDDYLRAMDVNSGDELWRGRLPAGGQATPMTYIHQGRQYVVIAAGGHSKSGTRLGDYVMAFALP